MAELLLNKEVKNDYSDIQQQTAGAPTADQLSLFRQGQWIKMYTDGRQKVARLWKEMKVSQ